MRSLTTKSRRRGTILLMIVGLLAMLFVVVSAYIILARFDRQALGFVRQGGQVTQILGSIHDVLAAEIRGPRTTPGASVTGAAYVDTPAYYDGDPSLPTTKVRGAPWLASPEPVRNVDPNFPPTDPNQPGSYRYPVVTGVSGKVSGRRSLTGLMWNAHDANPNEGVYVRPDVVPTAGNLTPDTIANARDPFTDATGDGIPDSCFESVSVLTELANALVGQSLRAGIKPDEVNWYQAAPDENTLAWLQFSELARYAVAARVISHGGMVQVSAPTDQPMWNSEFLGGMFNWIKHPADPGGLAPRIRPADRLQLLNMWAQRGAVEPVLRRRGGLLAGYDGFQRENVPPAMWTLQQRFQNTFVPHYGTFKDNNWQRFNLASLSDWDAWRQAVTIDPVAYNAGVNVRDRYVPRQLLTTVNLSDELAREQGQYIDLSMPDNSLLFSRRYWEYVQNFQTLPPGLSPGIEPGALKYYLGWIRHAFDYQDNFITSGTYDGNEVIRDLVSYFSEMLAGHKNFPELHEGAQTPDNVKRLQQAYMLAVNTVAFATPRGINGHVDAVYARDPVRGDLYIGYAPQPFITQVVAYNNPQDPPNPPARIALAVELYIPHDSAIPHSGSSLTHALDMQYFGLSINENFIPGDPVATALAPLSNSGRVAGRRFLWYAVHSGNNTFFDSAAPERFTLTVPYEFDGQRIRVKLWRRDATLSFGWYLVDEMEVETKDSMGDLSRGEQWYVNVRRDTSWEPYLGRWDQTGAPARWRMAVAFQPDDPEYKQLHTVVREDSPDPNIVFGQLGSGIDDPFHTGIQEDRSADQLCAIGGYPLGPAVPLHMMNAGADYWPTGPYGYLHGARRPESFPTVGYMLFVPRLSHMVTGGGERKPMSRLLRDLWKDRNYSLDPIERRLPPVDFGHMPIFDNTQDVHSGAQRSVGGFAHTGAVPWGLLVFDYFTTLDPSDAKGDGSRNTALDRYRVTGRININTAPWYVLAGLPLFGPDQRGNLHVSPRATPAFWSPRSGGLVGVGADGFTQRYPSNLVTLGVDGQWYRLGRWLAQSIAAYRDRVQYADNSIGNPPPFAESYYRTGYRIVASGNSDPYGSIRGGTDDVLTPATSATWKRGFLTLGELANVMGFDTSTSGINAENPVLGGYRGDPSVQLGGDFMKAVSLLALLDTHFLTTRSNTFTVYLTLTDRKDPQASVRSQVTIDRSNLLPRLLEYDRSGNGIPDTFVTQEDSGLPETVGQREVSYFNARHDE